MARTAASAAYERLNITLPRETVGLLDRLTTKGTRSRFIDTAIRERIAAVGRARLRKQLEQGYAARAARDLRMVEEWFAVDEDAWEHAAPRRHARK
jgi:CopG family transcriptional regulator/antitoxin EndoAI